MQQDPSFFIQIPPQEELFSDQELFPCNLPQPYRQEEKQPAPIFCRQDNDAIEEDLLQKTSQLHEAVRNKKLLQFQLLQATIMKKNAKVKMEKLERDLSQMNCLKQSLPSDNKHLKKDVTILQKELSSQKNVNQQLRGKIDEKNHQIIKRKQELTKVVHENRFLQGKNPKQHGYISIEKIKLEGQNQSKRQIIEQIKNMIGQLKDNISSKQRLNEELEEEYQDLLKELKKKEKQKKKIAAKPEQNISEKIPTTFRQSSDLEEETKRSYIDKENVMNIGNISDYSHSRSMETIKAKAKAKMSKGSSNTQKIKNKKKEVHKNCLERWVQRGGKSQSKRLY